MRRWFHNHDSPTLSQSQPKQTFYGFQKSVFVYSAFYRVKKRDFRSFEPEIKVGDLEEATVSKDFASDSSSWWGPSFRAGILRLGTSTLEIFWAVVMVQWSQRVTLCFGVPLSNPARWKNLKINWTTAFTKKRLKLKPFFGFWGLRMCLLEHQADLLFKLYDINNDTFSKDLRNGYLKR